MNASTEHRMSRDPLVRREVLRQNLLLLASVALLSFAAVIWISSGPDEHHPDQGRERVIGH